MGEVLLHRRTAPEGYREFFAEMKPYTRVTHHAQATKSYTRCLSLKFYAFIKIKGGI
jgi:hypothetical protein